MIALILTGFALAWGAMGILAVVVVLASGTITRRAGSVDEHFAAAARIVREDEPEPDFAEWERQWRNGAHP